MKKKTLYERAAEFGVILSHDAEDDVGALLDALETATATEREACAQLVEAQLGRKLGTARLAELIRLRDKTVPAALGPEKCSSKYNGFQCDREPGHKLGHRSTRVKGGWTTSMADGSFHAK